MADSSEAPCDKKACGYRPPSDHYSVFAVNWRERQKKRANPLSSPVATGRPTPEPRNTRADGHTGVESPSTATSVDVDDEVSHEDRVAIEFDRNERGPITRRLMTYRAFNFSEEAIRKSVAESYPYQVSRPRPAILRRPLASGKHRSISQAEASSRLRVNTSASVFEVNPIIATGQRPGLNTHSICRSNLHQPITTPVELIEYPNEPNEDELNQLLEDADYVEPTEAMCLTCSPNTDEEELAFNVLTQDDMDQSAHVRDVAWRHANRFSALDPDLLLDTRKHPGGTEYTTEVENRWNEIRERCDFDMPLFY